jgi:hypothetical protein
MIATREEAAFAGFANIPHRGNVNKRTASIVARDLLNRIVDSPSAADGP